MALPAFNPQNIVSLSINQIAGEFGGTKPHGINEYYRAGGLVPDITTNNNIPKTGEISLRNFYGAVNRISGASASATINRNELNYTFNPSKLSSYVAGVTDATLYINAGWYVYSNNTGAAGLTISGWTSGDTITIVNNGYIIGCGGVGGAGSYNSSGSAGGVGGPAIVLNYTVVKFTNNGYIAGGGGGGGGGAGGVPFNGAGGGGGGGGAGGGNGGAPGPGSAMAAVTAGTGGLPGSPGTSGSQGGYGTGHSGNGGGGGGRMLPGTSAGSGAGGQAGGGGGNGGARSTELGGAGGGSNGSGGGGTSDVGTFQSYYAGGGGGGGGWGASGGSGGSGNGGGGGGGGASGRAVIFAGGSITWDTTAVGWNTRIYGNYT